MDKTDPCAQVIHEMDSLVNYFTKLTLLCNVFVIGTMLNIVALLWQAQHLLANMACRACCEMYMWIA
jgi:hypothetical protein